MHSFVGEYNKALTDYHARKSLAETRIAKKQEEIARLTQEIADLKMPHWVDMAVRPLGDALAKKLSKHPQVLGPFGLRAAVSIYLADDPALSIMYQPTTSITIVPDFQDDTLKLTYDTGRVIRPCPPGSIAEMNQFGNELLPLPDSLEDIVPLLTHCKGRIEPSR